MALMRATILLWLYIASTNLDISHRHDAGRRGSLPVRTAATKMKGTLITARRWEPPEGMVTTRGRSWFAAADADYVEALGGRPQPHQLSTKANRRHLE